MQYVFRRVLLSVALASTVMLLGAGAAAAHSGGLDSSGGHYCREAGYESGSCSPLNSYHSHSGGGSSSSQSAAPVAPAPPPPPRDTKPPKRPKVGTTTVQGGRVAVPVQAERGSSILVLSGGATLHRATATGTNQKVAFSVPDGRHKLRVLAVDPSGNESQVVTASALVDTRAPSRPAVDVASQQNAAEVELALTGEKGSSFVTRISGPANERLHGSLGTAGATDLAVELPNGKYKAVTFLTDSHGNQSKARLTKFTVAVTAPTAPQISLGDSGGADGLLASLTAQPGTTVVVELLGEGASTEQTIEVDDSGTAEISFDVPDGNYSLQAVAKDVQGQLSQPTRRGDIVVDRTAPKVALDWVEEQLQTGKFAYRVVADAGTTLSITSSTSELVTKLTSDGSPIKRAVEVPAGKHTIKLAAVDAHGNEIIEEFTAEVVEPTSAMDTLLGWLLLAAFLYFLYRRRVAKRQLNVEPTGGQVLPSGPAESVSTFRARTADRYRGRRTDGPPIPAPAAVKLPPTASTRLATWRNASVTQQLTTVLRVMFGITVMVLRKGFRLVQSTLRKT